MRWLMILPLALTAVSCAHLPTTVSEADQSFLDRSFQFEKTNRPIKITKDTVVLDVRAFFDYQIASLPDAVYLNADDFQLKNVNDRDFEDKASALARRLALAGITPFSHVVVMGYGERGQGEEGRAALTLLALGIERVQLATESEFKGKLTNKPKKQKENQRYWEPRVVRSIFCAAHPRQDTMFVLNVDHKIKTNKTFVQQLATVEVPWLNFVNRDDFSPNYKVKKTLVGHKITESSPVMVRGQHGPLVTFNMIQLGYQNVCYMTE